MKNWIYIHAKEDWQNLMDNTTKGLSPSLTEKMKKDIGKAPCTFPILVCPRLGPWDYMPASNYRNCLHPIEVERLDKGEYPRINKDG